MDTLLFLTGDARFFWPENISFFSTLPLAWDSSLNTGVGKSAINTLWITSYLNITAHYSTLLGIPWIIINFFFWVLPTFLIAIFGTFFLFRKIIIKNSTYAILAGIIFTTNTYFLTVFFGGQQGVIFAIALMPLLFLTLINLLKRLNFLNSLYFSLVLSFLLLFDPRFFLLAIGSLGLFYILQFRFLKNHALYVFLIPIFILTMLHSYWIIPLILFKPALLPTGFNSTENLQFFSFAFFENSISLLHPNWPDNIFGKVSFMKAEFLLIPILAFMSLIYIKKLKQEQTKIIVFFALIGITGAFLAKGTNPPFGIIYTFLFENFPGFSMFRDSTKFYSLVAISYSILIPYTLINLSKLSKRKYFAKFIIISFILFWFFSLRLLPINDLLKIKYIPVSYIEFKDFIAEQDQYFRTLWIPSWQRYGYFSDINPAIGRGEIFKEASTSGMIKELSSSDMLERLQHLSVKYVIVPEDSEGELFLEDRKYDGKVYDRLVSSVSAIPYLNKINSFGKLQIFEIDNPRDRFWSVNDSLNVEYEFINSTKYTVNVQNAKRGDVLVFSESFNNDWVAANSDFSIPSLEFEKINSFVLPRDGNYSLVVYYKPQDWVNRGLVISSLTLIFISVFLLARAILNIFLKMLKKLFQSS